MVSSVSLSEVVRRALPEIEALTGITLTHGTSTRHQFTYLLKFDLKHKGVTPSKGFQPLRLGGYYGTLENDPRVRFFGAYCHTPAHVQAVSPHCATLDVEKVPK